MRRLLLGGAVPAHQATQPRAVLFGRAIQLATQRLQVLLYPACEWRSTLRGADKVCDLTDAVMLADEQLTAMLHFRGKDRDLVLRRKLVDGLTLQQKSRAELRGKWARHRSGYSALAEGPASCFLQGPRESFKPAVCDAGSAGAALAMTRWGMQFRRDRPVSDLDACPRGPECATEGI